LPLPGTIQIVQNFTADHALAAKAIRLPRGNLSSMDSPYLSLISLLKGWPVQKAQMGQSGIAKIADETGGEYYSLGTLNLASFKPYLDRLQRIFDNQYYLVFEAAPKKKAGLQRVKISTEEPNVEIAAADNVWVPAVE
jgi:hypothetical protein